MRKTNEYALAVTSQFPFCSMPLRLDSYSECQFACRYCFAASRGGSTGTGRIKVADIKSLERRLSRLTSGESPQGIVDEMLAARIPIHFGGMADPLMPLEAREAVTLDLLRVLRDYQYPTVISTKSDLCAAPPYIEALKSGAFIVQISLPSMSKALVSKVDVGAPNVERRLDTVAALAVAGVKVACRVQPLLAEPDEFAALVGSCGKAGADQLAVEHLKLAVEDSPHRAALSEAMGHDLVRHYKERKGPRVGREWLLPVEERLDRVLQVRKLVHSAGMLFGAADSDLLHLSDGNACCSSADLLGITSGYRFTFTQAVHAHEDGRIFFASIDKEWRPRGSISRYVNSKSRIAGGAMEDYVRLHWNGYRHGPALDSYYGVRRTDLCDEQGFAVYELDPMVQDLMSARKKVPHAVRVPYPSTFA